MEFIIDVLAILLLACVVICVFVILDGDRQLESLGGNILSDNDPEIQIMKKEIRKRNNVLMGMILILSLMATICIAL